MQQQMYKCPNHTQNLNNMRLNNKLCDVTIKVDGKEYRAHKNILAANLKYFEEILLNDSYQESNEEVITIDFVTSPDFEDIIAYAYTGEIVLTDINAVGLLEATNHLGEDGIKEACIEFLQKYLKEELACRVYKFAIAIDNSSLKDFAKSRILESFKNFSQTSEYLDLHIDILKEMIVDVKFNQDELRQTVFEAIIKWLMHDAENRKIHTNELLTSIDFHKLKADDLMKHLSSIAALDNDYGIVKDIMSCYQHSKQLVKNSEQVLIVLGQCYSDISFQIYDFVDKKWSSSQRLSYDSGRDTNFSSVVLNDKLYFIENSNDKENYLKVFDPKKKQITKLKSSTNILNNTALATCGKFLYLCGGENWSGEQQVNGMIEIVYRSASRQVLRYDPQTNSLDKLPPMIRKRNEAAAIFYEGCLWVSGGADWFRKEYDKLLHYYDSESVEKYDPNTNKWTNCPSMRISKNGHKAAVIEGQLYVFDPRGFIEVYDPANNSWHYNSRMKERGWHFITVVHDGKLWAIGGQERKPIEVYDPTKDEWQIDHEMDSGLNIYKPIGGLISSKDITETE